MSFCLDKKNSHLLEIHLLNITQFCKFRCIHTGCNSLSKAAAVGWHQNCGSKIKAPYSLFRASVLSAGCRLSSREMRLSCQVNEVMVMMRMKMIMMSFLLPWHLNQPRYLGVEPLGSCLPPIQS